MDTGENTFIGIAITSGVAGAGYLLKATFDFIRRAHRRIDALEKALEAERLYASQTYATKAELAEQNRNFEKRFDRIDSNFDRVFQKLDQKQEKR